jgi:hypothetical protein
MKILKFKIYILSILSGVCAFNADLAVATGVGSSAQLELQFIFNGTGGADLNTLKSILQNNKKFIVGTVKALIKDEFGGFYIAGDFILEKANESFYVAHVSKDGIINKNFSVKPDNRVNALLLKKNTLFLGGQFSSINGVERQRLAAVNLDTGSLTELQVSINEEVQALAFSHRDNVLYFGGKFTSVDGIQRQKFAALDLQNSMISPLSIHVDGDILALALYEKRNSLFVGGTFSTVDTKLKRSKLVEIDLNTGKPTSFFSNKMLSYFVYQLDLFQPESKEDKLRVNLINPYLFRF